MKNLILNGLYFLGDGCIFVWRLPQEMTATMLNRLSQLESASPAKSRVSIAMEPSIPGKYLSEALIFASTNPQYDDRLFIELQIQYMKIPSSEHVKKMLCTQIGFCFDIQNNLCTQHVFNMF